ncbi:hypothetical protein [Leucobacter sp. GX24907]
MTLVGKIRHRDGRVVYPNDEQLDAARATWVSGSRREAASAPTTDSDHIHLQKFQAFGSTEREARLAEQRQRDEFFDLLRQVSGFRVLTDEVTSSSRPGSATRTTEIVYAVESLPTTGFTKSQQGPQEPGIDSPIFAELVQNPALSDDLIELLEVPAQK